MWDDVIQYTAAASAFVVIGPCCGTFTTFPDGFLFLLEMLMLASIYSAPWIGAWIDGGVRRPTSARRCRRHLPQRGGVPP